jgi:hypothetical protein
MGKEPRRVARERAARDSAEEVRRLESQIVSSRRRLDAYVEELDRRRHRLMSLRRPLPVLGLALAAAGVAVGIAALARRRAKRVPRSRRKARDLREALGRMVTHPERVASEGKSPWSRILVAVAPIAAKVLADALLRRRR